jgi:hypothetical protein
MAAAAATEYSAPIAGGSRLTNLGTKRRSNTLAEALIRCQGQLHRVLLVGDPGKPKLVLCGHRDTQSERVMETLAGKACRCRQIQQAWRKIIQGPGYNISRPGSRMDGPIRYTDLPASFREFAKKGRAVHLQRRTTANDNWVYDDCVGQDLKEGQSLLDMETDNYRGDRSEATNAFKATIHRRMWRTERYIHETLSDVYSEEGVMIRLNTYFSVENPNLNVLNKNSHRTTALEVRVSLADLLRAHLRTGCLARQHDGKMAAVISIPKQAWRRPYRDIPTSQATLAWVVRQWRGRNWTMTQALLRRDNEEWKVDQWL